MKRFFSPLFLGLLALIFSISSVYAGGGKKHPPRHTVIVSVSAETITVDTGLNKKTYLIGKNTQCITKGNPVSASELKPGMRVVVTPSFDGKSAAIISAGDAPSAPPAAAGHKKK